MNTTHRTARIAAVLLIALVSWAIAAPLAVAAATSSVHTPKARTQQVRWYRWHPTAHRFHKHYGSKVMIGVESMQDFKSLRVEYGFDLGTAHEIPALHAVLVKITPAQLHALLVRAAADSRIRYVSPVHRKRQTQALPNDPYVSTVAGTTELPYEWAFLSTHVDRALDFTRGDSHIVVGIIDTGIANVPDLAGKIDSIWTVHGAETSQDVDSNDDYGHGTAVGSLIAANIDDGFGMAGFGGETHIIGIHAGDDGIFNDTQVAVALTKLVSLGVRIVNMSLGGRTPSEPILVDAIHNAAAQGVLLIASAGNDNSYVGWPAADLQPSGGGRSYGIAVGATDATGHRATFSDYGKHLSLVAPGTYGGSNAGVLVALPPASRFDNDFTTWNVNDAHYGYIPGTSFSAPEVSGVAALIWAAQPDLTNYQVADILKQSASRTASDWTPGMGCGTLDAGAALGLAMSRPASAWAETPNTDGAVCSALGNAPAAWPSEKNQTITFKTLADKHVGDRDFKVKARASSGLPVSFSAYGSCSIRRATVHLLVDGWCTVIATQAGNASYNLAPSLTQRFFVAKGHRKRHHV
jgi:subtilisin family serine protease